MRIWKVPLLVKIILKEDKAAMEIICLEESNKSMKNRGMSALWAKWTSKIHQNALHKIKELFLNQILKCYMKANIIASQTPSLWENSIHFDLKNVKIDKIRKDKMILAGTIMNRISLITLTIKLILKVLFLNNLLSINKIFTFHKGELKKTLISANL